MWGRDGEQAPGLVLNIGLPASDRCHGSLPLTWRGGTLARQGLDAATLLWPAQLLFVFYLFVFFQLSFLLPSLERWERPLCRWTV